MKSKIDIYNATMFILCVTACIFAIALNHSILSRIFCIVSAVGMITGIIIKAVKGGTQNAE